MSGKGWIGLAIVLALLAIRLFLVPPGPKTSIETPTAFDFQCMDCEHAWSSPTEEVANWYPGGMANDTHLIDCTLCKKRSALLKRKCLWCAEGYIPDKAAWKNNANPKAKKLLPEICSHCGKDVLKWRPQ